MTVWCLYDSVLMMLFAIHVDSHNLGTTISIIYPSRAMIQEAGLKQYEGAPLQSILVKHPKRYGNQSKTITQIPSTITEQNAETARWKTCLKCEA